MNLFIPCTVQILVRNGGEGLKRCLQTLGDFDEVIVHDGYSTDGTRELASSFPNVRILDQDRQFLEPDGRIKDFAAIRNQCIAAAKHDWVLVVDADEEVVPAMVEEVRGIVEADKPSVFQAFRRFFVDGEPVMFAAGYPVYQIRLFHRSQVEGYVKPVHERLNLQPGVVMHTLRAELPVPLPPASTLKPKYDRYLRMEVRRTGVMGYGRWFKWVLLRNLRTIVGLSIRIISQRLSFTPGRRMPFSHEFAFLRHAFKTIVATFPPRAARSLKKEAMVAQTSST